MNKTYNSGKILNMQLKDVHDFSEAVNNAILSAYSCILFRKFETSMAPTETSAVVSKL